MTEPDHLEDATIPDESLPSGGPPEGAMRAIFLIVLADLLGFSIVIPLLPLWAQKYHISAFQVGLLFSVYSVCQLIGSPVLGMISDRVGRRPVLIISQLGSVAGFILLGVAMTGHWASQELGLALIYLSRVIDGLSGGNISTAQAYISDVTTSANRAKGMGMIGAAFGLGFSVGPAVGGLLGTIHLSLPAYAAALLCLAAAYQTWKFLPESHRHVPSAEVQALLHPSRFLPIVRDSTVLQMLLIYFFSMMAFVMMESTFAFFMHDSFGYQTLGVGLLFALAGVTIAVVQGRLVGKWSKRFGEWPLVIAGPVLVAAAMLLLALVGYKPFLALVIVALITNATGRSLQTPTLSALISQFSDARQQGTVFGLFYMLGGLSRAIGPAIAGAVYGKHHIAPYLIASAITAAVAIWTLGLRRAIAPTPRASAAAEAV
ncbi:MAG: transporter, family, tetracycline resistance protein [Phycisphaerales bacterium]|nr:transporter, family, tetracycline resistance protein [Phycisphaerales bacterium]